MPMHLTPKSSWGDMLITLPFMVMPGHARIVIIGDKTLEILGVDIMVQLKTTVEGIGIGKEKESKKEDELGKVEKRELLRRRIIKVKVETLRRPPAGSSVVGMLKIR